MNAIQTKIEKSEMVHTGGINISTLIIIIFLLCSCFLISFKAKGKEFIQNNTKFQQYEQEVLIEPIDYFKPEHLFYYPTLFIPVSVYSPYSHQCPNEREKTDKTKVNSTLELPETYNINANNK